MSGIAFVSLKTLRRSFARPRRLLRVSFLAGVEKGILRSRRIITDTHERLDLAGAGKLTKALGLLDMFFRKDSLPPEQNPGAVYDDFGVAAKYPPHEKPTRWTEMRLPDGTLHTP